MATLAVAPVPDRLPVASPPRRPGSRRGGRADAGPRGGQPADGPSPRDSGGGVRAAPPKDRVSRVRPLRRGSGGGNIDLLGEDARQRLRLRTALPRAFRRKDPVWPRRDSRQPLPRAVRLQPRSPGGDAGSRFSDALASGRRRAAAPSRRRRRRSRPSDFRVGNVVGRRFLRYRLLLDAVPVLILLAAFGAESPSAESRPVRAAFFALLALSAFVEVLGVFAYPTSFDEGLESSLPVSGTSAIPSASSRRESFSAGRGRRPFLRR